MLQTDQPKGRVLEAKRLSLAARLLSENKSLPPSLVVPCRWPGSKLAPARSLARLIRLSESCPSKCNSRRALERSVICCRSSVCGRPFACPSMGSSNLTGHLRRLLALMRRRRTTLVSDRQSRELSVCHWHSATNGYRASVLSVELEIARCSGERRVLMATCSLACCDLAARGLDSRWK